MGAELKIIFDNLNKVKKSIEDGFKTGIMLEAKTQSSEFGKNIEKLTGQLDKTLKSQQKLEPQFKMLRKQQQLLSNNTKGLNIKIKENINKANKLITKYGNIQAKGGSDEALEKIELRLEKIKTQTEKFRLTIDKNGLIANQQDEKIKSIVEQANILSEEKMSLDQDLIAATEEIVNSFSYIDKVLYKIYNKMGMEKQKDNLIAKKLSGGASAKGEKSGGMLGMAAMMGLMAGGIMKLVESTKAIQFVMEVIGGMLNALIGPFLPILIGVMKPVFNLLLFVIGFMIKFFQDPVEALKDLVTNLIKGLGDLFGTSGIEKQEGAVDTLGVVAGAGIGGAVGGKTGAVLGALIGPELTEWGVSFFAELFGFSANMGATFRKFIDYLWIKITDSWNGVSEWAGNLWTIVANAFIDLGAMLGETWNDFTNGIKNSFISLWELLGETWNDFTNGIKNSFISLWELLSGFAVWFWETLKGAFSSAWELLGGVGSWIYDTMTEILATSLNVLSDIGSWIKTQIMKLWEGTKSIGSNLWQGAKNIVGINDGVVSPSGKLVSVNPKDYLLASKNPKDLMGGNSGGNVTNNIYLTVNGNADRNMIETIKRELRRELGGKGAF